MSLFNVYPLFDVEPVKAQGPYIWDKNGVKYLDMYGGHAVISIGHNHPHYLKRLRSQMDKISYYSNSVQNPLQVELAEKLRKSSGYDNFNLFLCNSGAEANENALKVASFYNGRKKIIAFKKSFHGRTSGAVSITDDPSISAAINENPDVVFLPMNDIEALNSALYDHKICAVIIEGIQGVGGVHAPTEKFMKRARALCDYTGALLILDEVQSGYGRTGKFFAHQHFRVKPDLITVAKGMGNGFPVAGTLIHNAIPAKFGMLGSTFGGNHLACAAALAVLEVIEQENLMQNALEMGEYLKEVLKDIDGVNEIRGIGLMLGIQLEIPAGPVRKALLEKHHIFTGSANEKKTIRILPALNITKAHADVFVGAFKKVMEHALVNQGIFS
ncbi:MAG: aspartate aminotransferase family protein [Bacteroidetes bacterium]|nr:aspartate aminotransferase family protein [Bacteroidota bacterium]